MLSGAWAARDAEVSVSCCKEPYSSEFLANTILHGGLEDLEALSCAGHHFIHSFAYYFN